MSLYKPLHYIFGEYVFETESKTFSRLANLLISNKLSFWGSEAVDGRIRFHCSVFSAEEINDTALQAAIPLEIIAKKGLPFIFSKYRKRYGLVLGLALFMFLMFCSQLFVWKISISGNVGMSVADIERELSECGIYVGSFIPNIDNRADSNQLLLNCKELSSAAISVNGTHVNVSVLERTPLPDFVDKGGYCNVVAARDGVIIDIDAADGTPEVKNGDVVYEGELLINSFIEGNNGTFSPTHARGTVYAAVKESFMTEIPMERVMKHYTGDTETKRIYRLLGVELPSFSGFDSSYEYFDAVTSERWIKLFGFIELPLKEYRVTYSEYIPETVPITEEYAELLVREEFDSFLNDLDLELLECETEFITDKENGVCRFKANAVLKQDIAKEVPFDIKNQSISDKLPSARE